MEFFTWEYLATYGGMTALVTAVTQLVKKYLPNYDPKWIALVTAVLGQIGVQVFYLKDWSAGGLIMAAINAVCVLLGAVGAYETVIKPVQKSTEHEDGDA